MNSAFTATVVGRDTLFDFSTNDFIALTLALTFNHE